MKATEKGMSPAQLELEVIKRVTEVLPSAVHAAVQGVLGIDLTSPKPPARRVRNGVKEPKPGGKCHSVWDELDDVLRERKEVPVLSEFVKAAEQKGINANNARIEFYNWRRFHGLSKGTVHTRQRAMMKTRGAAAGKAMVAH